MSNFNKSKIVKLIKKIVNKIKLLLNKNVDGYVHETDDIFAAKDMLTTAEYKFLKYKNQREENYKIDVNSIKHCYEIGLVSIVIPVYNGGELFRKSLNAVIKQTYDNIEIIIINDGSTDNTKEIAEEFKGFDKRITVINQQNQKLPQSISNGFKIARGEYFIWTGADDIMHENCIEVMINDLRNNPNVDFVYPNVKLIDENDEPIINNKWYNLDKKYPEYVILPKDILEFNIKQNNYIAPIALYKSIVVKTLGDFGKNKFTVEDYDYWMRINALFSIKHTETEEPIFNYRRHKNSLTSQAKELNISDKTNELMVYEDFRLDYYVSSMIWVIETSSTQLQIYKDLVKSIEKAGHFLFSVDEFNKIEGSNIFTNIIYVNIDNVKSDFPNNKNNIYKVIISDNTSINIDNYDVCISTNVNSKITTLNDYKGWFIIKDAYNIFAFCDIKCKQKFLEVYEDEIYSKSNITKKLSVIICTYKRSEKLNNAIKSSIEQNIDKNNYEILIVNNDYNNKEIKTQVENYRKEYDLSEEFLRYIEAPIKGLSYARNVGMFEARGEILLYIDDDSICENNNIEEILNAYKDNENAGVVGGQIILNVPNPRPDILLKGKESFWSEYKTEGLEYKKVENWYEFPYGANFSVRKQELLKIGGFRLNYGRKGKNFSGGEEVVVSSLIKQLKKDIIIAPKAKVIHDVEKQRYTFEHIEKTNFSGAFTQLRMELDLYIPKTLNIEVINYIKNELESKLQNEENEVEKHYLKTQIAAYVELEKEYDVILKEKIEGRKYRRNRVIK